MKELQIKDGDDPQRIINLLEDRIYEFNSQATGSTDGTLFSKIIQDERGELAAGIAGWIWAGACEITQLWVRIDFRNFGLGTKLLLAAELEAKKRNCNIILVRSYGFQAPSFYKIHGYKIRHVMNFPKGHKYYILTKQITASDMPGD